MALRDVLLDALWQLEAAHAGAADAIVSAVVVRYADGRAVRRRCRRLTRVRARPTLSPSRCSAAEAHGSGNADADHLWRRLVALAQSTRGT